MKIKQSLYFIPLLCLCCLNSCRKSYDPLHSKARWIKQYFEELESGKYPNIYAISWWNEDFDNSYLTINSSRKALDQYIEEVSDERYTETCIFESDKLIPVYGKIYHAAYPDFGGTEDEVFADRIPHFEQLAKKNIAWAYFSDNWYDTIAFPQQAIEVIQAAGRIPFIRMMPRSIFVDNQADPIWKLIDIANGIHDSALNEWAMAAKNCGSNLLVEFGTEVNGNWFSWNGSYNGGGTTNQYGDPSYPDGPEVFRDTYRHIIDICNQQQADNITWFFHIDTWGEPEESWNDPIWYYPGDNYIDWIGISTYGPQAKGEEYEKPKELLERAYNKMQSVSTNKPYAILEFGITEL